MTTRCFRFRATMLLVAAAASVGIVSPAFAQLDLTGTWAGTFKCKDVSAGVPTKPAGAVTMEITQSGSDVFATIAPDGFSTLPFQGHVREITGKPGKGAASLLLCAAAGGTTNPAELISGNAKVKISDPIKAKFKAVSTYEDPANLVTGGRCKYIFKRTGLTNPAVLPCGA